MTIRVAVADINREWMTANVSDLVKEIQAEGRSALIAELEPVAKKNEEALVALLEAKDKDRPDVAAAVAAERDRILGIQAHACEGAEDVIAECVNDPECTADGAAAKVLAHLKAQGNEGLEALRKTEPANPPTPSTVASNEDGNTKKGRVSGLAAAAQSVGGE